MSFTRLSLTSIPFLLLAGIASASPSDPFRGAARQLDTAAPEGTKVAAGDWGVSEQQGASTYTYPIALPPGRKGMAPSLALRYSSLSRLRGDVAAGWTLELPRIQRIRGERGSAPRWTAGGSELVEVADYAVRTGATMYRQRFDDGFVRYEQLYDSWIAYSPDGVVREYGEVVGSDRRFVSRETDAWGNAIDYIYTSHVMQLSSGEWVSSRVPSEIKYTRNDAAGLVAQARVRFFYAPIHQCGGIGVPSGASLEAWSSDGSAPYVEGPVRLLWIWIDVKDTQTSAWRLSRLVMLGYDADALGCEQDAAPHRELTSIREYAYSPEGLATLGPPVSFGYGPSARRFDRTVTVSDGSYPMRADSFDGLVVGATSTLVDMDGDGVLDRVEVEAMPRDETHRDECQLHWAKGLLGGGFAAGAETTSWLPTAKWTLGEDHPGMFDGCSASGQITHYVDSIDVSSFCRKYGTLVSYHFVDFDHDGLTDVLANVWATALYENVGADIDHYITAGDDGCAAGSVRSLPSSESPVGIVCECAKGYVDLGTGSAVAPDCGFDTTAGTGETSCWDPHGSSCPNLFDSSIGTGGEPSGGGCEDPHPRAPETWLSEDWPDGRYVWRVFYNLGGGVISLDGTLVLSPVPLTPTSTEASIHPGALTLGLDSFVDLDGDGLEDVIDFSDVVGGDDPHVFIGQSGPGLGARGDWWWWWPRNPSPTGYGDDFGVVSEFGFRPFIINEGPGLTFGGTGGIVDDAATFADVNGDGLVDLVAHVDYPGADRLRAYLNDGRGFQANPSDVGFDLGVGGAPTSAAMHYARDENGIMNDGWRRFIRRLVDIDGDGLLDLVEFAPLSPDTGAATETGLIVTTVRYNVGDRFLPPRNLAPGAPAMRRLEVDDTGAWHIKSDFLDADGDGVADLVSWTGPGSYGFTTITTDDFASRGAPRLLRHVDNGRGLTTDVVYTPTSDASTVSGTGIVGGHVRWVVKTVTTQTGGGAPAGVTRYRYQDPVFDTEGGTDLENRRLLGFQHVIRETPGNVLGRRSTIEHDYSYSINLPGGVGGARDGRGHQTAERVYDGIGASKTMVHMSTTTYGGAPLFDGAAWFVHPSETITRVCEEPTGDCSTQTTSLRRTTETWNGWGLVAGQPLLYQKETVTDSRALSAATGDRTTWLEYETRYKRSSATPTFFALQPYQVLTTVTMGFESGGATFALGETEYDTTGNPFRTTSYQDATSASVTTRTFDITGNPLSVRRPGHTGEVTYGYDSHRLFVAVTIDELGHQVLAKHDVATGALLQTDGPNSFLPTMGVAEWQGETVTIDGFGRPLSRRRSFDKASGGYTRELVETMNYDEVSVPNLVHVRTLRDIGGSTWLETLTAHDGAGRVIQQAQVLPGVADPVTWFDYDAAGTLWRVRAPDPRTDTGATVSYVYYHDGIGRPTWFWSPIDPSVSIAYAGLQKTTAQVAADHTGSTTIEVSDSWGRLVEVREVGASTAITRYVYDGADRLRQLTDADGKVTTVGNDWHGHRTAITRGARTWTYHYNLAGNLTAAVAPVPPGKSASDYTTNYDYDDLDRVIWKAPGLRGVTNPNSLGIGALLYDYDAGVDGIGRLAAVTWHSLDPATPTLSIWSVAYGYRADGAMTSERRTISLPGMASKTQQVTRSFDAGGRTRDSTWDDGSMWRTSYDERGMVKTVEWADPTELAMRKVADYTRSVAGQIRSRATDFAQTRSYTYDVLGRPWSDYVYAGSTLRAYRVYSYNGVGDIAGVTGTVYGSSLDATYGYDEFQRLVSATGPGTYNGTFEYSKTGNVRHAAVTSVAGSRDVTYKYGAVDPQAVDRLINTTGTDYASFSYDLSGNVTRRSVPAGTFTLAWDGEDQLRQVTGPAGTETYYYDHTGQRMLAVDATTVRFWFAESETHYVRSTGKQIRRYLHLSDGGGSLARVERVEGAKATIELQYQDALQNLFLTMNATGSVLATFTYGPFGDVITSTGSTNHRRRFNGKEDDATSGLRYYGFRYYDPLTVRWTSADPLYRFAPEVSSDPQRQNLYHFSRNNPVRYYDPDGREVEEPSVENGTLAAIRFVERATMREIHPELKTQFNTWSGGAGRTAAEASRGYTLGGTRWGAAIDRGQMSIRSASTAGAVEAANAGTPTRSFGPAKPGSTQALEISTYRAVRIANMGLAALQATALVASYVRAERESAEVKAALSNPGSVVLVSARFSGRDPVHGDPIYDVYYGKHEEVVPALPIGYYNCVSCTNADGTYGAQVRKTKDGIEYGWGLGPD